LETLGKEFIIRKRACPAPKFAATKPYNAASSGASLAIEEKEEEP
jgi:hypothetical protein